MGANNPNLPTNVRSDEEAIQYLASLVFALKNGTYTAVTGSPTVTAVQMLGGFIELSGGTTGTVTTDTAVNIIAAMLAADPNAGIGSSFPLTLVNDNSGTMTVTGGTGVTIATTTISGTTVATGIARKYLVKQTGAATVSMTVVG